MRVIVKPENRGGFSEAMDMEETKAYFACKVAEEGIGTIPDCRNLFEVFEEVENFFEYYEPVIENGCEEEFCLYGDSELLGELVTMVTG